MWEGDGIIKKKTKQQTNKFEGRAGGIWLYKTPSTLPPPPPKNEPSPVVDCTPFSGKKLKMPDTRQFFLQLVSRIFVATQIAQIVPWKQRRLAIFLLPRSLREVEVGSTLCNSNCNKNVARHVHLRACYTRQRSLQRVSQRRGKIARQRQEKLPSVTAPLV